MNEFSNTDVTWDATYDGLTPHLAPEAVRVVRDDASTIATLIDMLDDADRFVLAHVALTKIAGIEYSTFPAWNGLTVDLRRDGTVIIEPEQRHALAERWQKWSVSAPRPARLPD